jgi:NADH dehydrogenase [ubiquinone] 1 alpha subcomplex assembly factor 7
MPENQKKLHDLIAARIQQQGPVSVAEYMSVAAEAYYASKTPFGVKGDFTTSPEISQMFGEMVGVWLVDMWMQMGKPEEVKLVELGPGRGTLAVDIMRTISAWPDFKSAVTLHLVETSPQLRETQATALKGVRAGWYDSFSEVPQGFCFIIANEFFDALPIHQFKKTEEGWQERSIGYDAEKGAFFFGTMPLDFNLKDVMPEEFLDAPVGSIFEISPASLGIVEEISQRIARCGGAALIADYGHSAPGLGDTLQAVSKHQYSDVLEAPGEKDITAHVDFGTLAIVAGQSVGVAGPITQGQFLIALGIEARAEKLGENATDKQWQDITAALCRLVAPKEMGRLFKIMALAPKEAVISLAGFEAHKDETSDD